MNHYSQVNSGTCMYPFRLTMVPVSTKYYISLFYHNKATVFGYHIHTTQSKVTVSLQSLTTAMLIPTIIGVKGFKLVIVSVLIF